MKSSECRLRGRCLKEQCVDVLATVTKDRLRRIQRYKQIPSLLRELEALAPSKDVVKRKKAS